MRPSCNKSASAHAEGFIRIYRLKDGKVLELIHKTPVGGIPGALTAYKGRLLAGVGGALRIYDMGKKKLLRKSEYRSLPTHIISLHVMGDRIYVGDQQVSRHRHRCPPFCSHFLPQPANQLTARKQSSCLEVDVQADINVQTPSIKNLA